MTFDHVEGLLGLLATEVMKTLGRPMLSRATSEHGPSLPAGLSRFSPAEMCRFEGLPCPCAPRIRPRSAALAHGMRRQPRLSRGAFSVSALHTSLPHARAFVAHLSELLPSLRTHLFRVNTSQVSVLFELFTPDPPRLMSQLLLYSVLILYSVPIWRFSCLYFFAHIFYFLFNSLPLSVLCL